ncbi:unnamed protein product [Dovyalis caffra]|uniref:1-acylglycerol-3-phosphate O-acyltransferase n=1 Tax=Dovyalis caffra TaxID=77055 RepID=A0AAV1RD34_9ROSI|nr:unnamed protein product [Dovyalis caffra]
MAWLAALAVVPVGIIFVFSGLIVNLVQVEEVNTIQFCLCTPLPPMSLIAWEIYNLDEFPTFWPNQLDLLMQIEVYADDETFELLGKEHALFICNHKSDVDWLVGWILAQRSGCLGSSLAIMKKEAKFLPVIGWSMWFSDYLFLERSWSKDERTLQSGFERLADFPMPFWLALFVEGTRFTQAKLQAAQEFAASRGFPVPRNVLIPRTKGFVSAVTHLRSFVPAIYDGTLAVANNQPPPTFLRILRGQSSVIKVQIQRHSMQELPETADGIAQWCKDAFVTKDALLEKDFAKDIFSDKKLQDLGRPKKSLFVILFWSCLLVYATLMLFQWLSFLASWEVIACSVAFLLLSSFQELKDFPRSFWLTIFVEGTRITPDKLREAQEFAISKGLPAPRNVLIPRTKLYNTCVHLFQQFNYDVTVAVPEGHPLPSVKRFFNKQPATVHFRIKRYAMNELPESDEGISQWCRDRFVAKDAMLDKFRANGTFDEKEVTDFRRPPKKSLIVSRHSRITSLAIPVAFDAILMYALIEYTKLPKQGNVQARNSK